METFACQDVAEKFASYPEDVRVKLLYLRQLVFEVVSESNDLSEVVETIKWGEPSYVSPIGATLRVDWKKSKPNQYAMYFHCKTKLVETFREVYRDQFKFEGNRAIVFSVYDEVPVDELKHCISLSLNYHRVKHLPLLGA